MSQAGPQGGGFVLFVEPKQKFGEGLGGARFVGSGLGQLAGQGFGRAIEREPFECADRADARGQFAVAQVVEPADLGDGVVVAVELLVEGCQPQPQLAVVGAVVAQGLDQGRGFFGFVRFGQHVGEGGFELAVTWGAFEHGFPLGDGVVGAAQFAQQAGAAPAQFEPFGVVLGQFIQTLHKGADLLFASVDLLDLGEHLPFEPSAAAHLMQGGFVRGEGVVFLSVLLQQVATPELAGDLFLRIVGAFDQRVEGCDGGFEKAFLGLDDDEVFVQLKIVGAVGEQLVPDI